MDTRYGKYDGPAAALLERWSGEYGDTGDAEWSDSDIGEGSILWERPTGGLLELTWDDGAYLMREHDCTVEELDALSRELTLCFGAVFSWDSQGFLYGRLLASAAELAEVCAELDRLNEADLEAEEAEL